MSHKPDEDVPGVERITTVDKLGRLDIGRMVQLVYPDSVTSGARRAKRRRYFLKKIVQQPRFKGMMPQPPQFVLHFEWATDNVLTAGRWDEIGPLDGTRLIEVGPVFRRGDLRNPFAAPHRPAANIPSVPRKDRPANLAWRTESKS